MYANNTPNQNFAQLPHHKSCNVQGAARRVAGPAVAKEATAACERHAVTRMARNRANATDALVAHQTTGVAVPPGDTFREQLSISD